MRPAPNVPDNDLRRFLRLVREELLSLRSSLDLANEQPAAATGSVKLADLPPSTLASVAQAGIIAEASRRDHRHPYPTATQVGADPAGTAAAAVAAHEGDADPHPQYLTNAEGDAAYQPLDATLTAYAALTITANSIVIGTGADAFSVTAFAANTFPARASTGDLAAKTITDFGLSLIDDADAPTARATIGAAGLTGNETIAGNKTFSGDLSHTGTNLGFYGTAASAKPTITGSRGGNAALADLLTKLAALGLITDGTTA